MKKKLRILLIGGPGTGKSTLIHQLEEQGYHVHHEISREVTLRAQEKGVDQLFLSDPMAFSNELLAGRIQQYDQAVKGINFYDRGIPDVPAYHVFTKDPIPEEYLQASQDYRYDYVFHLQPWKEIYEQDNERYENFEQAMAIDQTLEDFYKKMGYEMITVPKASVNTRIDFILDRLSLGA